MRREPVGIDVSIRSDTFGRVSLTGEDARTFKRQVTYGRPSAAAVHSVQLGVKLARAFQRDRKVSIKIKAPA